MRTTGSYVWNVECRVCGFEKKSYEVKMRWDGVYACKECWEPRNILDFYQTRDDTHKLPYILPELGVDIGPPLNPATVTPLVCTAAGSSAYAGVAVAGCMIAGQTAGYPI